MAKAGKPRIWTEAERGIVRRMAMIGIPHEIIAKILKTRKETLENTFRDELDNSAAEANAAVAGALFKNAMSGNVSAQIFWCKTRLGWKEPSQSVELSGPDKAAIAVATEIIDRPPRETFEQWEERRKRSLGTK